MTARSRNNDDRHVVLGVTGSIAAFKAAQLLSDLRKDGHRVITILTACARKFVGEVTFEALGNAPVLTSLFDFAQTHAPEHVVAPATANFLGKVAGGIADDLLTSTVMAARSPVLLCPAMNDRMWSNPIVQENVKKLRKHGYHFCGPVEGWLADGYEGMGRMAEVDEIRKAIGKLLKG
jgi:phosphopantothenoylcysteine decarboxylase/phosphopantothenate--cysteine ligase